VATVLCRARHANLVIQTFLLEHAISVFWWDLEFRNSLGSQPLHNTIQYNGWTGSNPHGYTVAHGIHAKFESIYVTANVKRDADVAPLVATSQARVIDDEWDQYLDYLFHSNALVEKIYQLDKAGAFDGAGTPEGKTFAAERLAAGAIELRDLVYSAWVHSADPVQEYQGPA
jgi:hypothetical protein